MTKLRIYLDNAATSWPKRPRAIEAAWKFLNECGATAGRGTYQSAIEAERHLADARRQISRLIGSGDAHGIAFCSSGTHALNAALFGVLRAGDHVISTEIEHNSVLRPLQHLVQERGIRVSFARCDARGVVNLNHAKELIQPTTRWMVVGHASNVTGSVQDLKAWSELARSCHARLLVDASQTLGYLPIDVSSTAIHVLASAGHKGLGGLPGTGFLFAEAESRKQWQPLMTGGTGSHSNSMDVADSWPDVVEVGNHNLPGILSMGVAATELLGESERSPVLWQTHWRSTLKQLVSGLREIPAIQLIGYDGDEVDRVPLVSILVEGWDVRDLATVLDSDFGIEVRAGFHCAALVHQSIGSDTAGGTLRISPGLATTSDEIDILLTALRNVVG